MNNRPDDKEFHKKELTTKAAKRLTGMLISSFNDYQAARVLFMGHCFAEACCFACTCIEKYFKSFLLFDNINPQREHDLTKLYKLVVKLYPTLAEKLSFEYLSALTNIYKYRYIGDQPFGYNFTIVGKKFLGELDYTYASLDPHIRFGWKKYAHTKSSMLEQSLKAKDRRIFNFNYIAFKMAKEKVVNPFDYVYEVRVVDNGELLQMFYPTDESKCDGKFDYEALIIGDDNRSAKYTHRIIPPELFKERYKEIISLIGMNGI